MFDLPFNPDLLEQRIGRLDRIGQNCVFTFKFLVNTLRVEHLFCTNFEAFFRCHNLSYDPNRFHDYNEFINEQQKYRPVADAVSILLSEDDLNTEQQKSREVRDLGNL